MAVIKDATSQAFNESSGTTLNDSHTVGSGSNRILYAWVTQVHNGTGALPTSVVWNTTETMTLVANSTMGTSSVGALRMYSALYVLINPTSGTHNITATWASARDKRVIVAHSYAGARQSSQPEAITGTYGYFGNDGSAATLTLSSISNNAMMTAFVTGDGNVGFTASSPFNLRQGVTTMTSHGEASADLVRITAGSNTITWGNGIFTSGNILLISTAPADATQRTTYYVSQSTGDNGNDGSSTTPFYDSKPVSTQDALNPGDIVYLKRGDTWTATDSTEFGSINSSGTSASDIIFKTYGSGVNPKICDNSAYAGSWTLNSGAIYYASSITWSTVNTVTVNDTSALWKSDSLAHMVAGSFYFDDAADRVYVWLSDSSNPSSSTIRIGRYVISGSVGLLGAYSDGTGGSRQCHHITFMDIDVIGSNTYGVLIVGQNISYRRCKIIGSGNDGIITSTYGNWDGSYSDVMDCEIAYNVVQGNGHGQGVTYNVGGSITRPSRFWRNWVHHNGMAGVDLLDYSSTNSSVNYVSVMFNTLEYNAAWPGASFSSSNYDPGLYIDGASNILAYGNIIRYQGLSNGTNSSIGISVYSENPGQRNSSNVYILNNVVYGTSYFAFQIAANGTNIDGSWLMGNTFFRGDSTFALGVFGGIATDGLKVYYNIFANRGAAYPLQTISIADMTAYKGDYNVSSDNWYTQTHGSSTPAYIYSTFGEEQHSIVADPLNVNTASDATIDAHLQGTSPALNFSDGSQWLNLPDWVLREIGTSQPRGSVLASGVLDTGSADNGFHYNSARTTFSGLTITGATVT